MDPARDNILDRVRAALRTEAHRPTAPTSAPIFPPIANPEARFHEEFTALKGEVIENPEKLRAFLGGFPKIATDRSELVSKTVDETDPGVRECDLGVTSCDCLVAQKRVDYRFHPLGRWTRTVGVAANASRDRPSRTARPRFGDGDGFAPQTL